MTVTFANTTTKRTDSLLSDLPENIALDPVLNGRYDRKTPEVLDTVKALAASIKTQGQLTPAKVRKGPDGKPLLVFGYCRWHAVALINAEEREHNKKPLTRLEFEYEKLSDVEALTQAIQENELRVGVTDMDRCWNIQNLRKLNMPFEEIALIFRPAAIKGQARKDALAWVEKIGSLKELVPEAVEGVNKGEIKTTTAVILAKAAPEVQKKLVANDMETVKGQKRLKAAAVIAAVGKGKTAEKAKAAVQAQKDKKDGHKPAASAPATPAPPKVTSSVYEAAENLARAVDAWIKNEKGAEKAMLHAHRAYRTLVPFRQAEGEAA